MTPLEQAGDVDRGNPADSEPARPTTKQIRKMTEYLVYLNWKDGPGGARQFKTMKEALASAAEHVGSGYEKGHYAIHIQKVSRAVWEYTP